MKTHIAPHIAAPHIPDELLDDNAVAARLGTSKRAVTNWRLAGKIPYMRVGRLIRFSWPDVVAHLKRTTGNN